MKRYTQLMYCMHGVVFIQLYKLQVIEINGNEDKTRIMQEN